MNPDTPRTPREELELRITALLLGELSSDEAATLRELMAHDQELARLYDRLKQTISLVRETAANAAEPVDTPTVSLKLSDERREKLLEHFKTIHPKGFTEAPRREFPLRLVELAAVIALIGILAGLLLPSLAAAKKKASSVAIINNLRQLDGAKQQWALENNKSVDAVPTFDDVKPFLGRGEMPTVAGETYVLGKVGEPVAAEVDVNQAKKRFGRLPTQQASGGANSERVRLSVDGKLAFVQQSEARQQIAGQVADNRAGYTPPASPAPPPAQRTRTVVVLPTAESTIADASGIAGGSEFKPGFSPDHVDSSTLASPGDKSSPSRFNLITQKAPASDLASELYPPPGLEAGYTGVKGAATIVASGGAAGDVRHSGERTPRQLGQGGGSGGGLPIESPATSDQVALSVSEGFAIAATNSANLGSLSLAQPLRNPRGDLFTGGEVADRNAVTSNDQLWYRDSHRIGGRNHAVTGLGQAQQSGVYSQSVVGYVNLPTTSPNSIAVVTGDKITKTDLDEKLRTKQSELAQLRAGLNIKKVDAAGSAPVPLMEAETLRSLEALRIESETRAIAKEKLVSQLKSLSREEQKKVIPTAAPDPLLNSLLEQQKLAEQKQSASQRNSSTDLTEKSLLSAQAEELNKKVNDRIDQVIVGLDTQAASAKAEADKLGAEVQVARNSDQEKAAQSRPYFEKKRELEELVRLRTVLTMKQLSEKIDVGLPKTTTIEIVDRATPAEQKTGGFAGLFASGYQSTARIKVERDNSDISGLSERPVSSGYDPYFVQTEFEVIQSEPVLNEAVEKLKLNEAWAKQSGKDGKLTTQEATALLKKKLDLRPVRNTDLVEIRAKSDKPDEAAAIANAVAEAYRDYRLDQRKHLALGGIKALKSEFDEYEPKVRKLQGELDQLRKELNISDNEAAGSGPTSTNKIEPDIAVPRKPATNAPIPQPEIQTSENNFSSFSLNVSDVSFKLAMASLAQGQMPDLASIRSEEFINAFDYRDPEPQAGAPIAFAYERVRYPFAHNRDLLRFSLKTAAAGRQSGRAMNIVLLLDNSGSMERADRVQIIREALRVLAGQLQPQDKLSVITFARTARLVADGVSGDQAGEVTEQVAGLTPEGGTNLEDAMNLAYQTAARHYLANGINRVVLLTDGAANLGDVEPESLKRKVEAQRKQGIALDCFGIGWDGFNDDLLEVLSRNGDGRYGFINSPEEAATDFVGQLAGALKVAASDVKVQVEFNPKRVTSYRQIGYAKHQLTKEQFRDNTVDAAEIAAQEAGNALYTVEVNPAGQGPIAAVRVRYKVPGTTDYREQSWDVPYTGNALSLEQSSPAMRLAASASAFSEWLVASPFAGEVTPDRVLGVLRGVPEVYGADTRPKQLERMLRQAKSVAGE